MNPKSNTAMKNNRNGWLKIHYSLLDWEWYDDLPTRVLFQHLLLRANYADAVWHGIEIKRGQILTSRATLVKESGLTEQQVRTALKHLVSTNEITTEVTNKFTIITICNYVVYQGEETETNQQNDKQLTNNQPATNQQLTTRKEEYNNIRKKEKDNTSIIPKEKKEQTAEFREALINFGVETDMADELMLIRKKKKAINTKHAFEMMLAEANKAGITLAEAVKICVDNQWKGFKAEYLQGLRERNNRGGGGFMTDAEAQAICDAGMKLHEFIGRNRQ